MSLQIDHLLRATLPLQKDLVTWQRHILERDPNARWRIYLQSIVLKSLLPWFREAFNLSVQPWPEPNPWELWQLVSGLALTVGNKRIVIMVDEVVDATVLRVPAEWVDIPNWTADYYIAASVDVDEHQLTLWGYTSYNQLKSSGTYEAIDQTYCLSELAMVRDFSIFGVDYEVSRSPQPSLSPITSLLPAQASVLIQRLVSVPEPRLEVSFSQWAALVSDEGLRQQLYRQRQNSSLRNLQGWGNRLLEQGWQVADTLMPRVPALALRTRHFDSEAAVYGKTVLLNTTISNVELVLVVTVTVETDERHNIQIQLYPADHALLPDTVTMTLELPETGERLKTVQAGTRDNYIQLPPFLCPAEQLFRVCIQLADSIFQEDFVS